MEASQKLQSSQINSLLEETDRLSHENSALVQNEECIIHEVLDLKSQIFEEETRHENLMNDVEHELM